MLNLMSLGNFVPFCLASSSSESSRLFTNLFIAIGLRLRINPIRRRVSFTPSSFRDISALKGSRIKLFD